MNKENLTIYEALRTPPKEALKEIIGGRLKGMTDINPMWRIKALTEQFGICGIGWKYIITDKRLEQGFEGQIAGFVDIDLYIKVDGAWSDAIPGTGGSSFITKEKAGLYLSDEVFKMALTDALSVACKALGMGADIYYAKDRTKYSNSEEKAEPELPWLNKDNPRIAKMIVFLRGGGQISDIQKEFKVSKDMTNFLLEEANKPA